MSFIVSASTPSRNISYRHRSMLAALEQGLTLLSCGLENVRITDLAGRQRTPAEFSRVVFEGREAAAGASSGIGRLARA